MSEAWRTGLIVGAIGVLLVTNLLALMWIGDLRDEVNTLQSLRGNVMGLRSDIERTDARLEEIREEQQWVSSLDWTISRNDGEVDCADEVPMQASWSFREIAGEPDVFLEYRKYRVDDDWHRVEAAPVDEVDYQATFTAPIDSQLEHRIIAQSGEQIRTSSPEPIDEITQLTDRTLMFEVGESRNQDDTRWVRFVVDNLSPDISPCNEVVAAEIQIRDGDEVVESIGMATEYPGDYEPEGFEEDTGSRSGQAVDDAVVGSPPPEAPEQVAWWTDWTEWTGHNQAIAVVEFGDGTVKTLERMGTH